MNETEKQIVAWLERRIAEHDKTAKIFLEGGDVPNAASIMKLAGHLKTTANAIERGDHRQHSPATVKDS